MSNQRKQKFQVQEQCRNGEKDKKVKAGGCTLSQVDLLRFIYILHKTYSRREYVGARRGLGSIHMHGGRRKVVPEIKRVPRARADGGGVRELNGIRTNVFGTSRMFFFITVIALSSGAAAVSDSENCPQARTW